jgi:hypothetical protein
MIISSLRFCKGGYHRAGDTLQLRQIETAIMLPAALGRRISGFRAFVFGRLCLITVALESACCQCPSPTI